MRWTPSEIVARTAWITLLAAACSAAIACKSREASADASSRATTTSSVTATSGDAGSPADEANPGTPNPAAPSADASSSDPRRADAPPPAPPLPRLAAGDMPVYPRMSRRIGEEGWVEVAIDVRQDGEVVAVQIASSSGSQRLDEAVMTAARTWRFFPRTGERGVDRLRHRIVFQLTGK